MTRLSDGELTKQHAGYHDFKAIELMVIEIRERRNADLTLFEREALDELRMGVTRDDSNALALSAIDRLLKGQP